MNVRGGYWFVEEPYIEQNMRFNQWLGLSPSQSLVIVEIGSGFNTPGVIRRPMERITRRHSNAHLIRVNLEYPEAPDAVAGKATPVRARAIDFINALTIRANRQTEIDESAVLLTAARAVEN